MFQLSPFFCSWLGSLVVAAVAVHRWALSLRYFVRLDLPRPTEVAKVRLDCLLLGLSGVSPARQANLTPVPARLQRGRRRSGGRGEPQHVDADMS
jgi:hypothetical protein